MKRKKTVNSEPNEGLCSQNPGLNARDEQVLIVDQTPVKSSKRTEPIFIYSLFRAGSTYIFNKFRQLPGAYTCYQEPVHQIAIEAKSNPEILLSADSKLVKLLRHPKLDRVYFQELFDISGDALPKLEKKDIYDTYFDPISESLVDYYHTLIDSSSGRAVIQECRTSQKIPSTRAQFGGLHVYLARNPWDQWWSYKVDQSFSAANQLFINSKRYPEVIRRLRDEIQFEGFVSEDIITQISWFQNRLLSSEDSYLLFYTLWFLALREGLNEADLVLGMDALSEQEKYRASISNALKKEDIFGMNFADCSLPRGNYQKQDIEFFTKIEEKAHGLFLISGISKGEIDKISKFRHVRLNFPSATLDQDISRTRELVLKTEQRLFLNFSEFSSRISEAQNENERSKSEIQSLRDELAWRVSGLEDLQEQLNKKQDYSLWLENEWGAAKTELDRLSSTISIYESDAELLKDKLNKSLSELSEAQNENERSKSEIQSLRDELAWRVSGLEDLQEQLNKKQDYSLWLENEWGAAKTELDRLSSTISIYESDAELLKDKLNKSLSELSEAQNENERSKSEIQSLRDELAWRVSGLEDLQEQLNKKQDYSLWLENEWGAAKENIQNLGKELAILEMDKIRQDGVIQLRSLELETTLATLESERFRLQQLAQELLISQEKSEAYRKELAILEMDKIRQDGVIQLRSLELETTLATLESERFRLQQLAKELLISQEKSEAYRKELASIDKDRLSLQNEIVFRSSELEEIKHRLLGEVEKSRWLENEWGAAKTELDRLSSTISIYESDAELLKDKLNKSLSELSEAQNENERSKSEIQSLRDELAWRVSGLEDLQEQLNKKQDYSLWLENEWGAVKHKLAEVELSNSYRQLELEKFEQKLLSIYASTSWKITWPIRKISQIGKLILLAPIKFLMSIFRIALMMVVGVINRRPKLKKFLVHGFSKKPSINLWIRKLLYSNQINVSLIVGQQRKKDSVGKDLNSIDIYESLLSPSAFDIYRKLKKTLADKVD